MLCWEMSLARLQGNLTKSYFFFSWSFPDEMEKIGCRLLLIVLLPMTLMFFLEYRPVTMLDTPQFQFADSEHHSNEAVCFLSADSQCRQCWLVLLLEIFLFLS